MPFWMDLYFFEANSPVMEQLISFHDYSMIVMVVLFVFLGLTIFDIVWNSKFMLNLVENQSVEMVWTVVPMFLLLFIAVPSLRLLYLMDESFSPGVTVKVIGHQWYWEYEYTDFLLEFESFISSDLDSESFRLLESDQYLVLPLLFLVRFLVCSADVIHSWSVPGLGVKMDAIPGRLNQMSAFPLKPGLFYGQCSEICGSNHSFMPISLLVVELEDFLDFMGD